MTTSQPTLDAPDATSAADQPSWSAELLRGHAAVRNCESLVASLAPFCPELQSLGSLTVWSRDVAAQHAIPILILLRQGATLRGILLAQELCVFRTRTRLAAVGNVTGQRSLLLMEGLAPHEETEAFRTATDALFTQGKLFAALLSSKLPIGCDDFTPASARIEAHAHRATYDTFGLADSFDASLAHLGPHTRRNLRYYRRRAQKELGISFFPALHGAHLRDAILDLFPHPQDPLPAGVAKNRIAHVHRSADAFCMGVRARDGRWLSWVSGWRSGGETWIDWQCNRAEFHRYSPSTVMRAHLIEHESDLAQQHLRFLGGTPHTMHYGFAEDLTRDWLLVRRNPFGSLAARALRLVAFTRDRIERTPSATGGLRTRAARRHPFVGLIARMVGVIRSANS